MNYLFRSRSCLKSVEVTIQIFIGLKCKLIPKAAILSLDLKDNYGFGPHVGMSIWFILVFYFFYCQFILSLRCNNFWFLLKDKFLMKNHMYIIHIFPNIFIVFKVYFKNSFFLIQCVCVCPLFLKITLNSVCHIGMNYGKKLNCSIMITFVLQFSLPVNWQILKMPCQWSNITEIVQTSGTAFGEACLRFIVILM